MRYIIIMPWLTLTNIYITSEWNFIQSGKVWRRSGGFGQLKWNVRHGVAVSRWLGLGLCHHLRQLRLSLYRLVDWSCSGWRRRWSSGLGTIHTGVSTTIKTTETIAGTICNRDNECHSLSGWSSHSTDLCLSVLDSNSWTRLQHTPQDSCFQELDTLPHHHHQLHQPGQMLPQQQHTVQSRQHSQHWTLNETHQQSLNVRYVLSCVRALQHWDDDSLQKLSMCQCVLRCWVAKDFLLTDLAAEIFNSNEVWCSEARPLLCKLQDYINKLHRGK